jgi:hypothetical protein
MLNQTDADCRGHINPDPGQSRLIEEKRLDQIDSFSMGKHKLEGLYQMDVVELVSMQFFFRAEPAA